MGAALGRAARDSGAGGARRVRSEANCRSGGGAATALLGVGTVASSGLMSAGPTASGRSGSTRGPAAGKAARRLCSAGTVSGSGRADSAAGSKGAAAGVSCSTRPGGGGGPAGLGSASGLGAMVSVARGGASPSPHFPRRAAPGMASGCGAAARTAPPQRGVAAWPTGHQAAPARSAAGRQFDRLPAHASGY